MTKYEYKTLIIKPKGWFIGGKVNNDLANQEFNTLGAAGWELVSCVASNAGFGETRDIVCVFKRVKQ